MFINGTYMSHLNPPLTLSFLKISFNIICNYGSQFGSLKDCLPKLSLGLSFKNTLVPQPATSNLTDLLIYNTNRLTTIILGFWIFGPRTQNLNYGPWTASSESPRPHWVLLWCHLASQVPSKSPVTRSAIWIWWGAGDGRFCRMLI